MGMQGVAKSLDSDLFPYCVFLRQNCLFNPVRRQLAQLCIRKNKNKKQLYITTKKNVQLKSIIDLTSISNNS